MMGFCRSLFLLGRFSVLLIIVVSVKLHKTNTRRHMKAIPFESKHLQLFFKTRWIYFGKCDTLYVDREVAYWDASHIFGVGRHFLSIQMNVSPSFCACLCVNTASGLRRFCLSDWSRLVLSFSDATFASFDYIFGSVLHFHGTHTFQVKKHIYEYGTKSGKKGYITYTVFSSIYLCLAWTRKLWLNMGSKRKKKRRATWK